MIGEAYRWAMQYMNRMDRETWMLVLIGTVILGFLMLRGFGSRADY